MQITLPASATNQCKKIWQDDGFEVREETAVRVIDALQTLGAFLDRGEVPEQACIRGFLCDSVASGGLKQLRPELSDSRVVHFLWWLLLNHVRVTVSFLLRSPRRD